MADLLLEIFSEEIPARMQLKAETDLATPIFSGLFNAFPNWNKQGKDQIIETSGYILYSTPRRIALLVRDLPAVQDDIFTELKGPKEGAPEAAMQGFLKKTGLSVDQLEKRDGVYFATVHQKGKPTAEVIKTLIEETLASFPWPKSMRWGSGTISWVRPLHSIICLFDNDVVPVEFAGVKASNTTEGHRFLAPGTIVIGNSADYEDILEKACVIVDRTKRKAEILKQAEAAAAAQKLSLKKDEGLLEEVTGLVEWPLVLAGKIDAKFMDLPKEVLVSEMRAHQKYFALEHADGSLSDTFLITSNMRASDGGKAIIAGNERVLRARLSDGRFFWDQDRKKTLADWAQGLASVTYHAKLGSIADKVTRIEKLAASIAESIGADKAQVARAAALCKADLVTGMVGEFPELQGVMGRYYAQQQNETAAVADAIRDHYKPQGPGDSVPSEKTAMCVALADKLDTLIAMFAIGEKPTGSKDPFALRRAALGVIRIVLENNLRLSLKSFFAAVPAKTIALAKAHDKLVKKTEAQLKDTHKVGAYLTVNESATQDLETAVPANLTGMLYDFFIDRLKVQLKDSGMRHDVISAVVDSGDDDLVRIVARAKAVQDFLATDDGNNLLAGYKRAANILAIEEKKDKTVYKDDGLKTSSFKETAEIDLINAIVPAREKMRAAIEQENYGEAMKHLAVLRAPVDLFFDKIMVNCDDKELRINRLKLLASIRDYMNSVANFALIEGDSKELKRAA